MRCQTDWFARPVRQTVAEPIAPATLRSRDEVRAKTSTGAKPLVVLTAGAETDPTHDAAQSKLAALSTNTSHRVIKDASHPGLIMEQQYFTATTRAISTSSPPCAAHDPWPGASRDPAAGPARLAPRSRVQPAHGWARLSNRRHR